MAIRVELRERDTRAPLEVQDREVLSSRRLRLHLLSLSPSTPQAEALWLPVRIRGAAQNQPPRASATASLTLEVDQFILTPITTATLDATDAETPADRLVFNVTAPPAGGYITHTDDHTKPISSFTRRDLHQLKVAYQPPSSSQAQRRHLQVGLAPPPPAPVGR